jgi:aminoglycoside phosphotransferase (APT) family kinase protein
MPCEKERAGGNCSRPAVPHESGRKVVTGPATDAAIVDVVKTHREAERLRLPPLVILEGLESFVPGEGPLEVERLGQGHSNETFKVGRGGENWALRRPPRPPTPPTAHDVVREYRILSALADLEVRAPRPFALCSDPKLIGAPFYLMEFVPGPIIRDRMPPGFNNPQARRLVVEELVDTLGEIHAASWRGTALEEIGYPSGYLERQVRRWKKQWELNQTREVNAIEQVGDWLGERLPQTDETTLVHGDFKLDNAIYEPTLPVRLAVIVDWEMSTLGDPLADLGLLCATYLQLGEEPDPVLGFSPATAADGAPTRKEIVVRYQSRTGRDVSHLSWYEVLALWKIAILLEGSYKRFVEGTTNDQFFALLEDGVPRVAAMARKRIAAPGAEAI